MSKRFKPVVDKGIPIPQRKQPWVKHSKTWLNMEVGDSILFPCMKKWRSFQFNVKLHVNEDYVKRGLRVWKIKEELDNELL